MKKQFFNVLVACLTVLMLSSCNKEQQSEFVALSDTACSFNYDGGTVTVIVSASTDNWRVEYESSWLSVETGSNTITLTAQTNKDTRERQCIVSVIAGSAAANLTVYQVANTSIPVFYRTSPSNVFSPNGKYAAGVASKSTESGESQFYMVLLDLAKEETLQYGPFSSNAINFSKIRAVADNGDMFMSQEVNGTSHFNCKTLAVTNFDNGTVYSCSSDGTVAVGFKESTRPVDGSNPYWPYKWTNGVAEQLPLPERPYRATDTDPYWWGGCIARGVSADGRIAYGTEWQANDNYMIWWDENNNWHYVGEDIRELTEYLVTDEYGEEYVYLAAKGMMSQASTTNISHKGTWICGWYVEQTPDDDNAIQWHFYPGFYNTVENKTYIFWDYPDGRAIYAREDGIGFICTNAQMYQQDASMRNYYTVDINTLSTLGSTSDWFFDNFGIYPPGKSIVRGFSDDNTIALFENAYAVVR